MNNSPIIIREHDLFESDKFPNKWSSRFIEYEGLLLNPEANSFEKRYFIKWDKIDNKWRYRASYIVGAQWIDDRNENSLIILPKESFKEIDFLKIFSECLKGDIESDSFAKIYRIDMNYPRITTSTLDGILSPLLIVHFLSTVKQLLKCGLKKGYSTQEDNLRKIKGRIVPSKNERLNIIQKRYDRSFCRFQEFTLNIPENRLIKRALIFSRRILLKMRANQSLKTINSILNQCLCAFQNVSENIQIYEIKSIRHNKLYKEYEDACSIAKMILKRFDYSIIKASEEQNEIPPFWIDMPLLYEHYVLGLLKTKYKEQIIYQFIANQNARPDFLLNKDDEKLILDTKYMYTIENKIDIIRQLSGYARDEKILRALGYSSPLELHNTVIPCVFIYPTVSSDTDLQNPFKEEGLLLKNKNCSTVNGYCHFYKFIVPLPTITHA